MVKEFILLDIDLQLFAEDEDDNNPLSNFEDFVSEEEEIEEIPEVDELEEVEEEEQEEEESAEEEEKPKKKQDKPVQHKPLSKAEHALLQEKKKTKGLMGMMENLMSEVKALKEIENTRTSEKQLSKYVQNYIAEGYDKDSAQKLAEKDLKIDSISSDVGNLKKMFEEMQKGGQSTYETKTNAEQALLYKQAKAKQSKVDTISNASSSSETVKMTAEQKRDWENYKKSPWGQGKTAKEFLKIHKETFG